MGNPEAIETLTEKQRECLRMVLRLHSSKEIARELGIGVDAVDQRLKAAMKKLGVSSRAEAARILAEHEALATRPLDGPDEHPDSVESQERWYRTLTIRLRRQTTQSKFVMTACIVVFILTALGTWRPLEDWLRGVRTDFGSRQVSGTIALVAVDEKTIATVGDLPWPRSRWARLVNNLNELGVRRLQLSYHFETATNSADDIALAGAIRSFGRRIMLPVRITYDEQSGREAAHLPRPEFRQEAELVYQPLDYAGRGTTVYRVADAVEIGGRVFPAAAAALGREYAGWSGFPIEYSFDPSTISVISASDVLEGRVPRSAIQGKDALVGQTGNKLLGFRAPGYGPLPVAHLTILGAETYRAGPPREAKWCEGLAWGLLVVWLSRLVKRRWASNAILLLTATGFAYLPYMSEPYFAYVNIVPPISLLLVVAIGTSWISYQQPRGQTLRARF